MKVGMLPVWDRWGTRHAATVLQLDNCQVIQVKTMETDGYTSLQLGIGEAKLNRVGKCKLGQFDKINVAPKRKLAEFRVTPDAILKPGTVIPALHFVPGQLVDVCGITKGYLYAIIVISYPLYICIYMYIKGYINVIILLRIHYIQ